MQQSTEVVLSPALDLQNTLDLHDFDLVCAVHKFCEGQEQYSTHSKVMYFAVSSHWKSGSEMKASWKSERSELGKNTQDKRRQETENVLRLDRGTCLFVGVVRRDKRRQVKRQRNERSWDVLPKPEVFWIKAFP